MRKAASEDGKCPGGDMAETSAFDPCSQAKATADIGRRTFVSLVASAAVAWSYAARAQRTSLPVIGFLGGTSPDKYAIRLQAFHQGLKEAGYVEGQNVAIDYRWAEGRFERFPELAAELVRRQVTVLASAGGTTSALAAKAATSTIPVVFETAADPVKLGLVASLNRPGGNVTGVSNQNVEIGSKRLEVLHELLPAAVVIAVLVNPTNPALSEQFMNDLQPTARALGMQLHKVQASTEPELDAVFAGLAQLRADALVISPDFFFNARSNQLAAAALRQGLPAIYQFRPFAEAGGLVSYGSSETEYFRLFGIQIGKVLNGAKPADLPVEQSTKVELIVNLKTAKALGISVPLGLLGRADEVIE
jgi:putative ABC transport system substrate-binding protein